MSVLTTQNWEAGKRIEDRWEVKRVSQQRLCLAFRVYDHEQRKILTLKTPNPELLALEPQIALRFEQAGAAWAKFPPHQNVVSAFEVRQIDGRACLVLEYVPGFDLRQIQEELPQMLGVGFALEAGIQLCHGLNHLFRHGLKAHRGISPQNCLATSGKIIKISDIGFARVLDGVGPSPNRGSAGFWTSVREVFSSEPTLAHRLANSEGDVTSQILGPSRSGLIGGTPAYMAPELFDGPDQADVRSDIYAFGVLFFQLLLGKLPFEGRTWSEMERLHRTAPVPAMQCNEPRLAEALTTCLAKNRDDRFPDFDAVARALNAVYERARGQPAPQPQTGSALLVSQLLDQAAALRESDLPTEAITCYSRVIEIEPSNRAAWYEKGIQLSMVGAFDEALACFDRVLSIEPDNLAAWCEKGGVYLRQHRNQETLTCLDRAVELAREAAKSLTGPGVEVQRTGLGRSLLLKGTALMDTDNYQESLSCFEEAHRIFGEKGALQGMALCRHKLPKPESGAVLDANAATGLREGGAASKAGRFEEAILHFDHALKFAPLSARIWFHKASACMELGRWSEVVNCARKTVELEPLFSLGWTLIACALQKLSRLQESVIAFENSLEIDPKDCGNLTLMGGALATLKRFDEALKAFDQALQLQPQDGYLWLNKGYVLRNLERRQEAWRCFQTASQLGDDEAVEAMRQLASEA